MNAHTDVLHGAAPPRRLSERIRSHRVLASVLVLLALPWIVPNG